VTELVPGAVKRGYHSATAPLVSALLRTRITPNTLTTIGAVLIVVSAVAYGFGHVRLGAALLLASGIVDTLDGEVARRGTQTTKFGAFYDSTLDRIGDGATFIGIATYFSYAPDIRSRELIIVACMVAVLSSLLVSYMRARAEGLGLQCRVGLVQRAERILGIGLPTLIFGAGSRGLVLVIVVAALSILSLFTVVQRFLHVRREAHAADMQQKGMQRG
jgi:CDP-diacylglycerol--glycerol-3-phosphate 3-phosphatidyltransferase